MAKRGPGSLLSPEEWEARLVAHYLRSDGPFGGTELAWLDATPAELAIACGIDGISDAEAQAAFLAQFRRWSTADCFDGRALPAPLGAMGPGYFRFLVLTCLVSSVDQGVGETNDFRIRLGKLIDGGAPIQAVSGVNDLWRRLVSWCQRQREVGAPIRKIVLPPAGAMTLIDTRLGSPSRPGETGAYLQESCAVYRMTCVGLHIAWWGS
jgi:hypothetical protein